MTEESRGGRGGSRGGENRGRRRRYFKRRGEQAQGSESEARARSAPAANETKRGEAGRDARPEFRVTHEENSFAASSRSRTLRKRRRSRARRGDAPATTEPRLPVERDEEYVSPKQVYIYEHVVRPSAGGFEFRSESFSKAGRTLDDYQLDLEVVFNPPPREPVGQIVARVLAEYEAADALEAARSGRPVPLEGDEPANSFASGGPDTPLGDASRWTGRDPNMTAAEHAIEESTEAQEPPLE